MDTAKLSADTYREIIGLETMPGTNLAANLGHLVGYDAQVILFNKDLSVDSVLCLKFSQLEVYFSFSHAKLPSCPSASVITISLTLTCF